MQRFYFDHNATTPVAPEILEVYAGAVREVFGNASSIHHHGQKAKQSLEHGRQQVSALLGCKAQEIVFCSGGTEADNLALFGIVRGRNSGHVVTSAIEHAAVLKACWQLQAEGHQVTYVEPDKSGIIDPLAVKSAVRANTVLISIMHVNNEIGTVQPLPEIARVARDAGVLFHSDGVQAAGRIRTAVTELGVDLYSISAHKMYAPKGMGALYVRKDLVTAALLHGGRHEAGRRAGTENVPGVVGFGAACEQAETKRTAECTRLGDLRDRLEKRILERVPNTTVNGRGAPRVSNTSNLSFDGIEGEAVVIGLDLKGFAVSSGSACSSGAVEPSHVLLAMGLDKDQARSSVRFSLGSSNTEAQVDALAEAVEQVTARLRKLSPTYMAHA